MMPQVSFQGSGYYSELLNLILHYTKSGHGIWVLVYIFCFTSMTINKAKQSMLCGRSSSYIICWILVANLVQQNPLNFNSNRNLYKYIRWNKTGKPNSLKELVDIMCWWCQSNDQWENVFAFLMWKQLQNTRIELWLHKKEIIS